MNTRHPETGIRSKNLTKTCRVARQHNIGSTYCNIVPLLQLGRFFAQIYWSVGLEISILDQVLYAAYRLTCHLSKAAVIPIESALVCSCSYTGVLELS